MNRKTRTITARHPGACTLCGNTVSVGDRVHWNVATRELRCAPTCETAGRLSFDAATHWKLPTDERRQLERAAQAASRRVKRDVKVLKIKGGISAFAYREAAA